jgi:hypothetical protein
MLVLLPEGHGPHKMPTTKLIFNEIVLESVVKIHPV